MGNSLATQSNGLPVAPAGMNGLSSISAGHQFTCAAKNDGTLWCWGSGTSGQLGDPDFYHQPLPVAVLPF